jgi:hypothetical protein
LAAAIFVFVVATAGFLLTGAAPAFTSTSFSRQPRSV